MWRDSSPRLMVAVSCLRAMIPDQSAAAGIDQTIDEAFAPVAKALAEAIFFSVPIMGAQVPLIVAWLGIAALVFTVYFGFINLRGFAHALRLVSGHDSDPNDPGEVSHFQALATAVSGTVGIGNIGGVAITLSLGGPGAAFWIIVAGFLGMTTKFVECALGVKYRVVHSDGSVSGGPMYMLSSGLAEKGWPLFGKAAATLYAVSLVVGCLGIGNMFQANQAFVQFVSATGGGASIFSDKGWLFGSILALVVGAITIGGIKSIARVTEKLVPSMVALYLLGATAVLVLNIGALPGAIRDIVHGAFTPQGVAGGAFGAMILGFKRAVFSNEAGLGSAAIAHSAVQTREPITEGFVALLEPFIDTVVICTMTALVLTTSGLLADSPAAVPAGIELTSAAFQKSISWAPYPLSVAALLFAFSTLLAWSYYGLKGWGYLVGEGPKREVTFQVIFCVFIVLGATVELSSFLDLADALIYVMALPNILGLYLLAPRLRRDLVAYEATLTTTSP